MWLRREGENNREEKKIIKGWIWKKDTASTVQWKISISHGNRSGPPCCIVTDLTCPPDIHSQSSSLNNSRLSTSVCPPPAPYSKEPSIFFTSYMSIFHVFFLILLFTTATPHSCIFALLAIYHFPCSHVCPNIFSQWQLSFDSFLRFIFLCYSERTAGHRGPCSNKQGAVWFAEGGDTP